MDTVNQRVTAAAPVQNSTRPTGREAVASAAVTTIWAGAAPATTMAGTASSCRLVSVPMIDTGRRSASSTA